MKMKLHITQEWEAKGILIIDAKVAKVPLDLASLHKAGYTGEYKRSHVYHSLIGAHMHVSLKNSMQFVESTEVKCDAIYDRFGTKNVFYKV